MTGGVRLSLYVQPRASTAGVAGRHGEAIKIRLTAPPVAGAANAELLRFLARLLDVKASAVRLVSGETSRSKTVVVAGLSAAEAERRFR